MYTNNCIAFRRKSVCVCVCVCVEKYRYLQNVVVRVHKSTIRYLFRNTLNFPTVREGGGGGIKNIFF